MFSDAAADVPTLHPLTDAPDELELRRGGWKRQCYEIADEDRVFAALEYTPITGRGSGWTASGAWSIGPAKGIIHRRAAVAREDCRAIEADLPVAAAKDGGTIEVHGIEYTIDGTEDLSDGWTCARDELPLLAVEEIEDDDQSRCVVTLTEEGRQNPNLDLLLVITGHLTRAFGTDPAAAMVAAGTAVAGGAAAATAATLAASR